MGRLHDDIEGYMDNQSAVGSEFSADKESPRVLLAVSATFERLVLRNERCLENPSAQRRLTPFHGIRPPNISISKYLQRIHKYTNCSPSCFVVGFIYMDLLAHKQPHHPLISLNVHRLLLTSIMVATKLLDDVHYNNAFYSRVGGISLAELNSLEVDFLFRLDFRLNVTSNIFEGYCTHLERELILAGQRIERIMPILSDDYEGIEEQKMLKEAQRKLQPAMDYKVQPDAAASSAVFEPLGSPSRWTDL